MVVVRHLARHDYRWAVRARLSTPFTKAVESFARSRSMGKLMLRALSPSGVVYILQNMVVPSGTNLSSRTRQGRVPLGVLAVNTGATAIWTVGVFASLYAAYLNPNLRATTSNLSSVVNGLATILLFTIVDPWLSVVTDDVIQGRTSEAFFRHSVTGLLGSRLAGTILAQLLLFPAAGLVAAVANRI